VAQCLNQLRHRPSRKKRVVKEKGTEFEKKERKNKKIFVFKVGSQGTLVSTKIHRPEIF